MLRYFLTALLCFVLAGTANAAISLSCTPTETTTFAGKGVVMNCTASTGATSKPFHEITYRHTVRDPNASTWLYGAQVGKSKASMTGPIAAYVFEVGSTGSGLAYIWTVCASESGQPSVCNDYTINIKDQDTQFPAAVTECISIAGNFADCPFTAGAGATHTTKADADFDAALNACLGANANTRCLFLRGESTWQASTQTNITGTGAKMIGAYGSGAKPVINFTNLSGVIRPYTGVDSLLIQNLEFKGSSATAEVSGRPFVLIANASNITVSKVDASRMAGFWVSSGYNTGTGLVLHENTVLDGSSCYVYAINSAIIGNSFGVVGEDDSEHVCRLQLIQGAAFANNTLKDAGLGGGGGKSQLTLRAEVRQFKHSITGAANNGSGLIRLTLDGSVQAEYLETGDSVVVAGVDGTTEANGTWTVTVISAENAQPGVVDLQGSTFTNAFTDPGEDLGRGILTGPLLAGDWDTRQVYFADNFFDSSLNGRGGYQIEFGAGAATRNAHLVDILFERNKIKFGVASGTGIYISNGERMTVRNNIIDMTLDVSDGIGAYAVGRGGGSGVLSRADDIQFQNNTIFSAAAGSGISGITFGHSSLNLLDPINSGAKNNLCYFPNNTGTTACIVDYGDAPTLGTNTGNVGAITTNPFTSTPNISNPVTLAPSVAGYADNAGAAAAGATCLFCDFFQCHHKTAATYQIGALVDRANAICAGAP